MGANRLDSPYATTIFKSQKSPTPMNQDITLSEAQTKVDEWIKTVGVRYFNELTNTAILMEEVGELARIMSRTYGEQSFKDSDKGKDLGDEMADILWVLICLANQTGVDLTEAWKKNLEKKNIRDQDRHRNNEKLK
ncbi:nucleotide pyrophosphohydrolase [Algoriphagus aestuariicola]|jgi:NTP pyrophosphatase (non-canonical NTP hydrolase)